MNREQAMKRVFVLILCGAFLVTLSGSGICIEEEIKIPGRLPETLGSTMKVRGLVIAAKIMGKKTEKKDLGKALTGGRMVGVYLSMANQNSGTSSRRFIIDFSKSRLKDINGIIGEPIFPKWKKVKLLNYAQNRLSFVNPLLIHF